MSQIWHLYVQKIGVQIINFIMYYLKRKKKYIYIYIGSFLIFRESIEFSNFIKRFNYQVNNFIAIYHLFKTGQNIMYIYIHTRTHTHMHIQMFDNIKLNIPEMTRELM